MIGPERLPKTARTLGHLFGRLQRYVNDVKADINREMELDELRKLQREVQGAARDFEQSVTTAGERREDRRSQRRAGAERRRPAHRRPVTPAPPPLPVRQPANLRRRSRRALPGFDKI